MELTYAWLIFLFASFQLSSIHGRIFHVSTYGAYPDDNVDDVNAIQTAVDMAIKYGPNTVVVFESGTYTISAPITVQSAVNLTITGQGMQQTLLLGTAPTAIFLLYSCQQMKVTLLSIDFDPLSFTAGYVINVTDSYFDLKVQPPHQADVGQLVPDTHRFDVNLMRPAIGPRAYQKKQIPPPNITTSLVSPGILRVPLASHSEFIVGDAVVVRYAWQNHVMRAHDTTDLTIQSITIYASWSMGFYTLRVRRLNVIDYHVLRKADRWLSTSIDCLHFADNREYINIFDSQCISMGDDGLNVHASYLSVAQVINSTALILQAPDQPEKLDVGVGTDLEFTSSAQPFTRYATAAVISISAVNRTARLFILASPINASAGDFACVADTPVLTIRNFTVASNRGRGLLLETRNAYVTRSIFDGISGSAVYFQPSMSWHEGPTGRNITLDQNLYLNCNEGIDQYNGLILFLSDPIQLVPVVSDVRITSSTFIMGEYSQGILQIGNGANVSYSGNYISTNNSMPLIWLCNSRNISASNNTVVDKQSPIDEYYTYITTDPCNMNLSSLIDLPPSAFNSSFPPPVMKTTINTNNMQMNSRKKQSFQFK